MELLNRCLNDYPKGIIIGKDTTIGRYVIGEHELSMEKVTYHIGFSRKPGWLEEDSGSIDHVGIVESVGKGNVNTVEGNSGDKVKRCSYPIGDSEIYGYGTLVT